MYKRIMIVVDERPLTRFAVKEGVELARTHGAEVLFFSVLPRYTVPMADVPPFVMVSPEEFQQAARGNADKALSTATLAATKAGVVSRTAIGSGEDDAHCIAEAAGKRHCDLVVVASEARNALLRLLTGSVIPGLITASPVPVLVCKERKSTRVAKAKRAAPLAAKKRARPVKRPATAL